MNWYEIKIFTTLNYSEHILTSVSAVPGCISISDFASLVDIFMGMMISTIGLNIPAIVARIKKYKLIIKEKKKKHNKTIFLAETKLNSINGLTLRLWSTHILDTIVFF